MALGPHSLLLALAVTNAAAASGIGKSLYYIDQVKQAAFPCPPHSMMLLLK